MLAEKGHMQKACRTERQLEQSSGIRESHQRRPQQWADRTHLVEESDQEDVDEYYMFKAGVWLQTYTKKEVPILGSCLVTVQYGGQKSVTSHCGTRQWPKFVWKRLVPPVTTGLKAIFWTQQAALEQVLNAHKEEFDKSLEN